MYSRPSATAGLAYTVLRLATDHPDVDYARIVELAPLVVDTRSATHGLTAPAGRIVGF